MTEPFSWADNKHKLELARVEAGVDASEEAIKEIYVRLLGKVVPGFEVEAPKPEKKVEKKKK